MIASQHADSGQEIHSDPSARAADKVRGSNGGALQSPQSHARDLALRLNNPAGRLCSGWPVDSSLLLRPYTFQTALIVFRSPHSSNTSDHRYTASRNTSRWSSPNPAVECSPRGRCSGKAPLAQHTAKIE